MHLRELLRLRIAVFVAFVLAVVVAISVSYTISLTPPSLTPRSLEMGTATTRVLIDTQRSTVLDLRYGTSDFDSLTSRGVLLGNVMASLPVREYIARRAKLPADVIEASTPLTPDFPRPAQVAGEEKKTSDIFRSTDQYRLNIQVNPTVPILEVFAQAPSAEAAASLANAAVDGLRDYITDVAEDQDVKPAEQAQLIQLGRAHGAVVNSGIRLQALLLVFFIVFALACATILFVSRVRVGWKSAEAFDEADAPRPPVAA